MSISMSMSMSMSIYTIADILRALLLADACHLLQDQRTKDVTAWRDSRAWSNSALRAKIFKIPRQNKTENI